MNIEEEAHEKMETESTDLTLTYVGKNNMKSVQTQTKLNGRNYIIMRRKIKTLKQKVRRRDIKIRNMKELIQQISQNGHTTEDMDSVLKNYFEGTQI